MKIHLTILFLLFRLNHAYADNPTTVCQDTFVCKLLGDSLFLNINGHIKAYNLDISIGPFTNNNFEVKCLSYGVDLIQTLQDGNNYQIIHRAFVRKDGNYILDKIYILNSTRHYYQLYGFLSKPIPIEEVISFDYNYLNEKFSLWLEIIYEGDFQADSITAKIDYLKLLKSSFAKKDFKSVSILTNEIVIDLIIPNLATEINFVETLYEIGMIAYDSKKFTNSAYIFSKIIAQSKDYKEAYLILANSYWEVGRKTEAKVNYLQYINTQSDSLNISKYIFDRLQEK